MEATPSTSSSEEEIAKRKWYKQRKIMTYYGLVQNCLVYFEYTSVSISALYYYQHQFHLPDPKFFYGLSMAVMYISVILSVVGVAKYMDRTRNMRLIVLTTLGLSLLENIVYTMTFWRWLPIIGRFLCGFNEGARASIAGELSRTYRREELGKIFSTFEVIGVICLSLAPCTPLLFKGIQFDIIRQSWIITEYNFIGFFLAIAFGLLWIFAYFFIYNLTLDPSYRLVQDEILGTRNQLIDTTADMKNPSSNEILDARNDLKDISTGAKNHLKDTSDVKNLLTIKDVFTRSDIFFILLSGAVLSSQYYQMEVLLNMTAVYHFNLNMSQIGIATIVGVSLSSAFMFFLQKQLVNSSVNIYYMFLWCSPVMMSLVTLWNLTIELHMRINTYLEIAIVAVLIMLNTVIVACKTCYGRLILFSLAPADSASIIDSYRKASSSILTFFCFLTSSYVFSAQLYVTCFNSVVLIALIMYLVKKRKYFICELYSKRH